MLSCIPLAAVVVDKSGSMDGCRQVHRLGAVVMTVAELNIGAVDDTVAAVDDATANLRQVIVC